MPKTSRHCEVRSNLYAGQSANACRLCIVQRLLSCLANDGVYFIFHKSEIEHPKSEITSRFQLHDPAQPKSPILIADGQVLTSLSS